MTIFCCLLESLQSPQNHENSPSILHISMEEPCTMSTPNFASLPSYQVRVSYHTSQYLENIWRRCEHMNCILELNKRTSRYLQAMLGNILTFLQVPAETKAQQFIVTPSPSSHDQRDEGTPQVLPLVIENPLIF